MLFAQGSGTCLALGCSSPWLARSVGYVGTSDGWQDLRQNGGAVLGVRPRPDGNVALCAELGLSGGEPVLLALGFGRTWSEAAFLGYSPFTLAIEVAALLAAAMPG